MFSCTAVFSASRMLSLSNKGIDSMVQQTGILHKMNRALGSLKLTLFVFLTLAVFSIIGTLLPQGMTERELHERFGPGLGHWIESMGFHDVYRTGWFRFLLLLLCVNLIVCSLQRLPKTLRLMRHEEGEVNPGKLLKLSHSVELTTHLPWEEATSRLTRVLTDGFAPPRISHHSDTYTAYAIRGKWSPLMVYVVHFSVLVVLAGALLGSIFGFKGFMQILEGESSDEVILTSGHQQITLPFKIHCDDFDVSFYDTGAPKEFRSDLTVLSDDQPVHRQTIRVNDPMSYAGITFYQSSYGSTLKLAELELSDKAAGTSQKVTLRFRETALIPGTRDRVQLVQYQPDFSRFGPAVGVVLQKEGQEESSGSWILVNMPDFHGNRIQNYHVKVLRTEASQYTGLQVKKDPGVWLVYAGFTAMIVGIGLACYTSQRKIWIWAAPKGNVQRIVIGGRANKNSLAFEAEFTQLCERLTIDLKQVAGKRV
jgi:cytochrome c biogenesis protein